MICKQCKSANPRAFNGEVAIHFPGLEGLAKSIVWAFPKLSICLHCGFAEFTVPERELQVLKRDSASEGALVLGKAVGGDSKRLKISGARSEPSAPASER